MSTLEARSAEKTCTKVCTKCGESKPLSEYYHERRKLDGRQSECKDCARSRMRERRKRNPEHVKAINKRSDEKRLREDPKTFRLRQRRASENWIKANKARHLKTRTAARQKREAMDPEKHRLARRALGLRQYGLSLEGYNQLLSAQGGVCAVTKNPFIGKGRDGGAPVVDHCHLTGGIRGIISNRLNRAIGLMHDCPVVARAVADYLEKFYSRKESARGDVA